MALYQCPTCGNPVSSSATRCPNCGSSLNGSSSELLPIAPAPVPPSDRHPKFTYPRILENRKLFVIGFIVIAFAVVFFFANRLTPEEKYQVNKVEGLISNIGDVQLYSGDVIQEAQEAFDALTSKCQRKVKNKKTLSESYDTWNYLKAKNVSEQIDAIGEIKSEQSLSLQLAQNAYDALTDVQKKQVSNYDTLVEAQKKLSELKIKKVENLISDIGTVVLDIETRNRIERAQNAYNNTLDDVEKSQVHNYSILQSSYEQFGDLATETCILNISQIGDVTLESRALIETASEMYELVWSDYRSKITNYPLLQKAESTLDILQAEELERQKRLSSGDSFETENWNIKYNKSRISAKILPNNTSGYYSYYYCHDDSIYVDLVFTVKNTNTEILSLNRLVEKASITYNSKYTYTSYMLFSSSGSSIDKVYSWDGLNPLNSTTLHVAFVLPREAKDSGFPIEVSLTLDGTEKTIVVR